MSLSRRACFCACVILLSVPWKAAAQGPAAPMPAEESRRKTASYLFVSPNTRENLSLEEAVKLLDSPEETQLVNGIRRLSRCLGLKPMIMKTIGSWMDGAEHSTLARLYTDRETLRYEEARLGKAGRQKSVLSFRQHRMGEGRMYIINAGRRALSLAALSKKLDAHGISFRTLVPRPNSRAVIYVVDLKNELRRQIAAAARGLRARLIRIKGTGEFLGDDEDRDKAQQVYAEVIRGYEERHPRRARLCSQ